MEIRSLLYQNPQFEPSAKTKKLWLYCRREETRMGSPGLLCSPKQWDQALFFIIIILELIGLYLFYEYVKSLTFAIAFFLADVIFAISAHLVYGEISLTRNRLFLLRERIRIYINRRGERVLTLAREGQISKERWKLFRLKLFSMFFYSMISMLGGFKILGFIANWPGRDPINSISVTICLTYIIVALLQIYTTGYFTFSSLFFFLVNKNLGRHTQKQGRMYAEIEAGNPTRNLYEGIDMHTMLLSDPKYTELGFQGRERESLPKFNNCSVRNHFIHDNRLFLYGVVTDDDLNAFVNSHANNIEAKQILGLILLELQLDNFSKDGGIDKYTEPIPFPAGNIAGSGAIEPGRQKTAEYSVDKVANDLDENRKERTGQCWEYEWVLEEHIVHESREIPSTTVRIPEALTPVNQLSVRVSFDALKAGHTYYLSVYVRNLAVPFVRGISSPPFPIRLIG